MTTLAFDSGMGNVSDRRGEGLRLSSGRTAKAVIQGRGDADGDWAPQPESLRGDGTGHRTVGDFRTTITGRNQPWPLKA
ncbi:MAG: hypothetical protein ACKO2L_17650 [Planctomycetaceae bacterium]